MNNGLSAISTLKLVFRFRSSPARFAGFRRNAGWELLTNSEVKRGAFRPKLTKFLNSDEPCLWGDEFLKRVVELGDCAGQRHAENILRNQNKIPKSWRRFMLIFPGTVWQSPPNRRTIAFRRGLSTDRRRVPCLRWRGSHWRLFFPRIAYGFYESCRIICIREVVFRGRRRSGVIGKCAKCKKKKFIPALGLCWGCYKAQLRSKVAALPH